MIEGLAPLHLALSVVLVLWNILQAGRIGRAPFAAPPLAALSALAGLLILPALVVSVATTSIVYGRALDTVRWVWPVTATIIALQALLVATTRAGSSLVAVPIAVYNGVIALAAGVRYADTAGQPIPDWLLAVPGSQAAILAIVGGSHALVSAVYLNIPVLAPAFRSRWRATALVRYLVAAYALVWAGGFAWGMVRARRAVRDYARYDTLPLHERNEADFAVGLHILPKLARAPYPVALARDLRLVDTLGARAVSVTILPQGATTRALDSLARVLDPLRRDSILLLVRIGYPLRPRLIGATDERALGAERVRAAGEIARRLRPDVVFPAPEPYGEGARAVGTLTPERWRRFMIDASRSIRAANPRTKMGVLLTAGGSADSALFAWAASAASPVEVIGMSVTPSSRGPIGLDARTKTFDRWMAMHGGDKPLWIYVAGAPAAHGERNQARAVWGGLAWATGLGRARGAIVMEAGDYGALRGLRRVDGGLRPAALTLERAIKALRESSRSQTSPER